MKKPGLFILVSLVAFFLFFSWRELTKEGFSLANDMAVIATSPSNLLEGPQKNDTGTGDLVDKLNSQLQVKEGSNSLLTAFLTFFYGEIAFLLTLWILFTSDIIGIIFGLFFLGLILAFTLPRRSRRVAVVVLAALNFFLGLGIVLTVINAEPDPVPAQVLISILPLAGLLYLAVKWAFFSPKIKEI